MFSVQRLSSRHSYRCVLMCPLYVSPYVSLHAMLEHFLRSKAQLQAQLQVCPYVSFICVPICVLTCYARTFSPFKGSAPGIVKNVAQALCGIHRNNTELYVHNTHTHAIKYTYIHV
jgi:hypothetical protein